MKFLFSFLYSKIIFSKVRLLSLESKAIAFSIAEELKKNNLPSINALIRDGNVNLKYGEDKITNQYEYVLLERNVK